MTIEGTLDTSAALQQAAAEGTQETVQQDPQQETSLGGNFDIENQDGQEIQENGEDKQPPTETDKKEKEDKKEENEFFGKPETYDYKDVKLPENMKLDETMTGKFNEYAAKLNLSQKGANNLMAMAVELTQTTQQQTAEAIGKLHEEKINEYRRLLNSDKDVGGAHLKESIAAANLAYDEFFKDEQLRVMIAESGLNVHPKFIKALRTIGSQMQNDTIHSAGNSAGDKKNREDILYPTMAEQ